MAKKSHKFTVLSDVECSEKGCDRKLKQRLVEQKEPHNITKCNRHYWVDRLAHKKNKAW